MGGDQVGYGRILMDAKVATPQGRTINMRIDPVNKELYAKFPDGVEIQLTGAGSGVALILGDGTLVPGGDAVKASLPFRSDNPNILGELIIDKDNPDYGIWSNFFKNSANASGFWGGVIPVDSSRTMGRSTWDDFSQIYPESLVYEAIQRSLGNATYIEHGSILNGDVAFNNFYSASYKWTTEDLGVNDIDSGFYYEAAWRQAGVNGYAALNVGFNFAGIQRFYASGGYGAWNITEEGPRIDSTPNKPAYYQNNPSIGTIGANKEIVANTLYSNSVRTPLVIENPFYKKFGWNSLYENTNSGVSGFENQSRTKSYDAIFYVGFVSAETTVSNGTTGDFDRNSRVNNKTIAFATIATAWQQANLYQIETGLKALVWVSPGLYNQALSTHYSVDLYFDYKAILYRNNPSAPVIFTFQANQVSFNILGQGTFYNEASINPVKNFSCAIGSVKGSNSNFNMQADFVDSYYQQGGFGYSFFEPVFEVKRWWSPLAIGRGAGGCPSRITFQNTSFINGYWDNDFKGTPTSDEAVYFEKCLFQTPYFGHPDTEIIDKNGVLRFTFPNFDTYDTSVLSPQGVIDDIQEERNGLRISACVQLIPRSSVNFRVLNGRWYFNDCEFLISKENTLAMIYLMKTYNMNVGLGYASQRSEVVINGGIVNDWSGTLNGSAFFTAVREQITEVINWRENIGSVNSGGSKYIDSFTGNTPTNFDLGGVYYPVPNLLPKITNKEDKDELIDISSATDNVDSDISTVYYDSTLEILVSAVGGAASAFLNGTTRGGSLASGGFFNITVKTDRKGVFVLNQTDKTIIQLRLVSVTNNRG